MKIHITYSKLKIFKVLKHYLFHDRFKGTIGMPPKLLSFKMVLDGSSISK